MDFLMNLAPKLPLINISVGPICYLMQYLKTNKTTSKNESKKAVFVLVFDKNSMSEQSLKKLEQFLLNLKKINFTLEDVPSTINENIIFIKISVPDSVLRNYAKIFNIPLSCEHLGYRPKPTQPFKFMANILTVPDFNDPIYQRAKDAVRGVVPRHILSAEKGLIIYKVLLKTSFGDHRTESGIEKLLQKKILLNAFPLHDGSHIWIEEGFLNDRQLLKKFWSQISNIFKQQPLDLIEKYYGPEVGFYFAWLGFYNRMLVPASIVGVVLFLMGLSVLQSSQNHYLNEICHNNQYFCPRCTGKNCELEPLRKSCFNSRLALLADNPFVVLFSILMSIWSTVFLELWRREEAMLQIRWNLRSVEIDRSMRPEFEAAVMHQKFSPVTGEMEPYMPKHVQICRYVVTGVSILLMLCLVIVEVMGVTVYVKTVSFILQNSDMNFYLANPRLLALFTGSAISFIFIMIFEFIYEKLALVLTTLENPRTQADFDNSYVYKCYALSFINYYSAVGYIAFIKGRFYTHPGETPKQTTIANFYRELCDPAGCTLELAIQIIVILLFKNIFMTVKQYVLPQVLILLKKIKIRKNLQQVKTLNQWEADYLLNETFRYYIMQEYTQMVIQYGFVTFFVSVFPPAPLLALFNNIIELRVDAYKMVEAYRRPVAIKTANIAAWNGIIRAMTYLGVATNAFVIAFTSEFVHKMLYRVNVHPELIGYINASFSLFNLSDFPGSGKFPADITVCYYPGQRYPPDDPRKYQFRPDFWYNITWKLICVVIFEHLVMIVTGIISYTIPNVPFSVREHISYEKEQYKEAKMKIVKESYLREHDEESNILNEIQ